MDLNEYFEVFIEEVREIAIENGCLKSEAFVESSLDRITETGEIDSYDIISADDLDEIKSAVAAYSFNILFGEVTLFVNLYQEMEPNELSNLTNSELKPAFRRVERLLKKIFESENDFLLGLTRTDAYFFVKELKNQWPNIKTVKVIFLTNKPLSKRYEHSERGKLFGKKVAVGIWDLQRFFEVESSGGEREQILVSFEDTPLAALEAAKSDDLTSYLVVMPAHKLAQIYSQYKSRVLEQNVRSFLQNRSKVNKGIKITLGENPERFFAYNNGITSTAREIKFNDDGKIIELENLQIVNGGQTTAQIYNAHKEGLDLTNVSVQMKLNVITDKDVVDTLVPNVAKFANSQNPVSEADLFSNSPYHQRIEDFSRKIIPPIVEGNARSERWFYERSRGQYLNEQADFTPAKKREFQRSYPKPKMITKTDLALVLNAWDVRPNHVSKGAQANFKVFANSIKMEKTPEKYNEQYFKDAIVKTLIYRELRKEVLKQPWYSGFPANIVAYTVAWFAHSLKETELYIDIASIWQKQKTPDLLIQILIDLAGSVNDHLGKHIGNPTTYAKGEQCWEDMLSKFDVLSLSEIPGIIISQATADELNQAAEEEQDALDDLVDEVTLISIHPDCWINIKEFIGRQMSESKHNDIEKLRRCEIIPDFKLRQLAKFVRQYQKQGGQVIFRSDMKSYTVS